ncbi:MAG: hypothetical protein M3256_22720 [Actinomycetota bacterium]|nr:hypothetical protein [Actinomycetota bacterium]
MVDPALLSEAVVWWTGFGRKTWPSREDDCLIERFGEDVGIDLVPRVKEMATEFSSSDARLYAATLSEMGARAASEFRQHHPELAEDAVQALAWCYTFDFK